MAKKGQDIMPLDESEYTGFEEHSLTSGDGFTDGFNDDDIVYESTSGNETPIKVFNFNTSSEDKGHSTDTFIESSHNNISQDDKFSKPNKTSSIESPNLSTSPVQKIRGLTPKIDGEAFDVKRCYQFRASTIKKLNQLKGESDNINIYLNEIIDAAICFYHNSVFNKK